MTVLSQRIPVLTALGVLLASATVHAVGTRTFVLDSGEDFKGGDLTGVAVDSVGRVRAGFNLGSTPLTDVTAVWSALALADGSVVLATGNEGKLLEVRGTAVKVLAETGALVATSLTEAWGGALVVGTLPEGKVMKWERGKLTTLAKLDAVEHVWQVAWDPKTRSVFAATGPEGKLFRIDQQGQAQVHFDAEEKQLMSVAVAPDGTVYAGSSDKAKLYRVAAPGRATVVHDFGRTEVRAVAVGARGEIYAIANEIKTGSHTPALRSGSKSAATPAPPTPKTTGKGTLYRFDAEGAPEQLLDDKDEHFVSLTIGDDGQPYVGTGVEGRIYTVDDTRSSVLVADVEERMVGALVLSGKQRFAATGDPAVLRTVRGTGGQDAVWTSKVFDAGLRARFGKLSWTADGALELSTRTGNTKEPDDTWSAWSAALAAPGAVASPPAQFFQVRARWTRDPKAVLHEVTVPFLTDNLRAVLTKVEPSGSKSSSESVVASGGPLSDKPSTKVELKWTVDNPDKDELRYRLEYRLVGTTHWFDLLKPGEVVTKENYSWETKDLPEGVYRVRVTATDELSNPPDRTKSHTLESTKVVVDNTPPVFADLVQQGRRIRGIATDGVGPITRIEVALAGSDEFRTFHPADGIFDEQREEFDLDVSSFVPAGPALVVVRIWDKANNSQLRHLSLK